jgi:hypothetical protein
MVQTSLKVKLETFDIINENDDNARDEPFLWTFFLKIDGSTIDIGKLLVQDVSGASVYMYAPTPSHYDLQLNDNEMDVSDPPAAIPSAIGEWNTNLQTSDLLSAFNPGLSKYSMIVTLAIGLEKDETTDANIQNIWSQIKAKLQEKLNDALRNIINEMLFEGQTLTEQQVTQKLKSIDYNLFRDIAKKVIETSFAENFIVGIVSPYNLIKAISQVAFPDDFIGYAYSGPHYITDLISMGTEAIPFQLNLHTEHPNDGVYRVKGNIYQPESVGYANISLCYAHNPRARGSKLLLFGRTDSKYIEKNDSSDHGTHWGIWRTLPDGVHLSGPATAMSEDGRKIIVVVMGSDTRYWAAYSSDGGSTWNPAWVPIGEGVFKSAPAIVMTPDGKQVQIFGVGLDNNIWRAVSSDGGSNWYIGWQVLPEGNFTSAPSACISRDGKKLHVMGRGSDNKFWRGFSGDGGNTWDLAWWPMGEGIFISAPACVMAADGTHLRVYGRGTDNKFWEAYSPDGGSTWTNMWGVAEDNGTFISSPSATMSSDGNIVHLAGIGMDLQPWIAYSSNGGTSWDYAWQNIKGRTLY